MFKGLRSIFWRNTQNQFHSPSPEPIRDSPTKLKELEYIETLAFIRHTYDSRAGIFSFTIGLNAVLIGVYGNVQAEGVRLMVVVLALLSSYLLLMIEKRTIHVLDSFVKHGIQIEDELGISLLANTWQTFGKDKIRTRTYFTLLYYLLLLLWLSQFVFTISQLWL